MECQESSRRPREGQNARIEQSVGRSFLMPSAQRSKVLPGDQRNYNYHGKKNSANGIQVTEAISVTAHSYLYLQ
ncbi:hypothetical protein TNCV_1694871 [Trichonephila clavipes]|nr:hypothetical protein TNCV_1694871 [Trichonephila clavipes]